MMSHGIRNLPRSQISVALIRRLDGRRILRVVLLRQLTGAGARQTRRWFAGARSHRWRCEHCDGVVKGNEKDAHPAEQTENGRGVLHDDDDDDDCDDGHK